MLNGQKICVVMPGYNAELTVKRTYDEIPKDIVDDVILVDDGSSDKTAEIARQLGVHTVVHPRNRGYGGNQKTCYSEALQRGADIVVMVHPDYQYTPRLIPALTACVASGVYDVALGSRILGNKAVQGGMPVYKYISNRVLTAFENILLNERFSEYHTGYRAFSRQVLETLPLEENGEGFIFDNQMLVQAIHFGFRIGEVSCPTRYATDSSSIGVGASIRYGLGVLATSVQFRLAQLDLFTPSYLSQEGRRLKVDAPCAEEASPRVRR